MVRRRRHTLEQIVRELDEADRLVGEGKNVAEVAWHLKVPEATHPRWRTQYGPMSADEVRRLEDLEVENARLERDRWAVSLGLKWVERSLARSG